MKIPHGPHGVLMLSSCCCRVLETAAGGGQNFTGALPTFAKIKNKSSAYRRLKHGCSLFLRALPRAMTTAAGLVPGKGGRHRTQEKELEALLAYIFTIYVYILPLSPTYVSISTNLFVFLCLSSSLFVILPLSLSLRRSALHRPLPLPYPIPWVGPQTWDWALVG